MNVIVEPLDQHHVTEEQIEQLTHLLQKDLSQSANVTFVRDAISSPHTLILIARHENTIVGSATAVLMACVTGKRVHIEDVVVDSGWRQQGIATRLIQEAISAAKKKLAATSIDLTSRPHREAANALYKKLGFVQRKTNVYRYEG